MKITALYNPLKRNRKLKELNKLEEMLRVEKIPYKRIDREGTERFDYFDMRHQIIVFADERWTKPVWSAICSKGSHGYNSGLIELLSLKTLKEETGFLTAEEAMGIIKPKERQMTDFEIELTAAAELSDKILDALDETECSDLLKMAIVPTLFDHICEKGGFDKKEMWDRIGATIKDVNEELGPMYPNAKRKTGTVI